MGSCSSSCHASIKRLCRLADLLEVFLDLHVAAENPEEQLALPTGFTVPSVDCQNIGPTYQVPVTRVNVNDERHLP